MIDLGLRHVLTWNEAEIVLEAVEHLDRAREELVDLVAHKRHEFYRSIGGSVLSVGAFRAKVRHELATEEHV